MNKRTGEQRGGVAGGRGSQMALYSLAIEYIPRLLAYMPRIRTNKPGYSHLLDKAQHTISLFLSLSQKWVLFY